MRTITRTIELYAYDELDEPAQLRVVREYVSFLAEVSGSKPLEEQPPFVVKAAQRAEQTPWFYEQFIFDAGRDEILEDIRGYGQAFLSTGDLEEREEIPA